MIKFSYITTNCYGVRSSNGSYATAKAARLAGEANNRRQEWLGADGLSPMFNGEIEKTIVLSDADKALQLERKRAKACKPLYHHHLNIVVTRPLNDDEINALTKQESCFGEDNLVF